VLIFASGVRHGRHVADVFERRHKVECGFVCGETLPFERDETLRRFRSGDLKYFCTDGRSRSKGRRVEAPRRQSR
jgi:DNA repair protein RadD